MDSHELKALMESCAQETAEELAQLIEKIESGEITKGAIRLIKADGTPVDFVFGLKSPEEEAQYIAMLQKQMDDSTEH